MKAQNNKFDSKALLTQWSRLLEQGPIIFVTPYEQDYDVTKFPKPNVFYGYRFTALEYDKEDGLNWIFDAFKLFEKGSMSALVYLETENNLIISKSLKSSCKPLYIFSVDKDSRVKNEFLVNYYHMPFMTVKLLKQYFLPRLFNELLRTVKNYNIMKKSSAFHEVKNLQRDWKQQWSVIIRARRWSRVHKARKGKRSKDYKRGA